MMLSSVVESLRFSHRALLDADCSVAVDSLFDQITAEVADRNGPRSQRQRWPLRLFPGDASE